MGNKLNKAKTQSQNSAPQQQYQQESYIKQQQMSNNNDDIDIQYQQPQAQQIPEQLIRRLNTKPQDANKQTVAVIVTFSQHGSYDALFETVQQKAQQGTRVLVYKCSSHAFKDISKAFEGEFKNDVYKELITEINKVDHDCVVFNWECCGFYSSQNFAEGRKQLFQFVKKMIDKKFMCMFSDFSLKALVREWDQHILGPNPFQKIGQTSTTVQLKFISGQLKECPSAQLQTVGEMAEQGKVNVHTLGGTIMYSVNKKNLNHDKYKLKVLTVATNLKVDDSNLRCKIGQFQGAAGHVLVNYPSGGSILTSMTHWIQLMKVDTSEQKLFDVAVRQYGESYANQQRAMYTNLDQSEKVNWRAQKATQFIQNQAPCTNMKRKAR